MTIKISEDLDATWRNIRILMNRAITFSRGRESARGLAGTTLQSSIADAIRELDSAQGDPIESLGEQSAILVEEVPVLDYSQDPPVPIPGVTAKVGSGVGKGKLQKVEDMILLFYGDGGANVGVFEQLQELTDPEV
jgi:hypothetical protein